MIKGVSKNVVIVRGRSNELFEEAIFILKPEKSISRLKKKELTRNIEMFLRENTAPGR